MHYKIFPTASLIVFLTWGLCNASPAFPGHALLMVSGITLSPPPITAVGNATKRLIASDREGRGSGKSTYEDIEKQLKELSDEIKRLEENVRDKIRKEILPHIKKELEKLKKRLKELRPGKKPQEPVLTRAGDSGIPENPRHT